MVAGGPKAFGKDMALVLCLGFDRHTPSFLIPLGGGGGDGGSGGAAIVSSARHRLLAGLGVNEVMDAAPCNSCQGPGTPRNEAGWEELSAHGVQAHSEGCVRTCRRHLAS